MSALRKSNRYPGPNTRQSVPDIRRTRGLPAPLPHQRRSSPVVAPANQNPLPRTVGGIAVGKLARLALRGTKLARMSNPITLVAGEILEGILDASGVLDEPVMNATRRKSAPNGSWSQYSKCGNENGGTIWSSLIAGPTNPCLKSQFLSGDPHESHASPEHLISTHPGITHIGVWRPFFEFVWKGDHDVSYFRPSGAPSLPAPKWYRVPAPVTLPWPKTLPVPQPHELPVGYPRPNLPRWVRNNPREVPTAETYARAGQGGRFRGSNPPGGINPKPKPRRNRDDLDNPGTSGPGVTEKKGTATPTSALGTKLMDVVGSLKGRTGATLGMASEILDLVEALHGALPDEIRAGSNTPDEMMMDLIRSGHRLDAQKAVTAVLLTLVVDDIVGRAISRAEKNWIRGGLNRATQPGATNRDVNNFVETLMGYY